MRDMFTRVEIYPPIFSLFLLSAYGFAHTFAQVLNVLQNDLANEQVHVKIYYESLCPGSRTFYTQSLAPAVKDIPEYLDVQTYPYGNAQTTDKGSRTVIQCQHGPPECYGNKLHACAIDIFRNNTESTLFNACTMEKERGLGSNDDAVIYCGKRMLQDPWPIIQCARGSRGKGLLEKAGEATQKHAFSGVPYVLINDKRCEDLSEFWTVVCAEFQNAPNVCR